MKSLECGGEHRNEGGRYPVYASTNRLTTVDDLTCDQRRTGMLPKSVGTCPDCGTQQVGNVYRISPGIADFLRVKSTDTFLPDKHHWARKASTR